MEGLGAAGRGSGPAVGCRGLRRRAVPLVGLLLVVVTLALASRAEAFVYWTEINSGTIARANLDGTGVDRGFISGADLPVGVAVDASHVYWANEGFFSGTTIGRANLDGTGADQSFITGAKAPAGVAVDASHVYWANEFGNSIGRANLDGTGVDQSFIKVKTPCGPAVDGSHIYWGDELAGNIGRARLDGTRVEPKLIDAGFGACPVAVNAKHVYWAEINTIGRARLNGSGVDQNFIAVAGVTTGVALDAKHIYWGDGLRGTIGRANLNGTGVDELFICGAGPNFGIAVDTLSTPPPPSPSSELSFCEARKNVRKGTATLTVKVAGPGELTLVKTKNVKGVQKSAKAAGNQELTVKPRGGAKKQLKKTGRAKVDARVTFTPDGGEPNTERKRIKLIKG